MILRLNIKGFWREADFTVDGRSIKVTFRYDKDLIEEIKTMQGAKWNGDGKYWTISDTLRNSLRLKHLQGEDIYAWYDSEIKHCNVPIRDLKKHQVTLFNEGLQYRFMVWAAEMGTGKTLASIEVAECLARMYGWRDDQIWYVGPKAGVRAVGLELAKWRSGVRFTMHTFDALVDKMKTWKGEAPRMLIVDESSKVKNFNTQRSQACALIAHSIRKEHGTNAAVLLMSGSPAPKEPTDWWSQCEIASPGFIREGDAMKFKSRLCLMKQEVSLQGGTYPKLITWLDDEKKCAICGKFEEEHLRQITGFTHKLGFATGTGNTSANTQAIQADHQFKASVNEVARLYKRLRGLVRVFFKKDVTDLPPKIYHIIQATPTVDQLRSAQLIRKSTSSTITGLILLRQLSDGFQYSEEKVGDTNCPHCHGTGRGMRPKQIDPSAPNLGEVEMEEGECMACDGSGLEDVSKRKTNVVGSPKDEVLRELLDQCEEQGRIIIWGGFSGTLDRVEEICRKEGWGVMRVDGKGVRMDNPEFEACMDATHPRQKELAAKHAKVAVVANPKAAGMAYTWHAASVMVYYSNDFDGEARIQSEDRAHRLGMPGTLSIYDIFCLPSDKRVYENLKQKKRLQDLTLGEFYD